MQGSAIRRETTTAAPVTVTRLAPGTGLALGAPGPFRVSLVLFVRNGQETVQQAIHEAEAALALVAFEYEIIVVDDGSTDATAEVVGILASAHPRLKLVRHAHYQGYGAALRSGVRSAVLDLVVFAQADCRLDLGQLAYLLPLTRSYDIICGCRSSRGTSCSAGRLFLSWGYNTLIRATLGSPVHDIDCPLKIFQRDRLPAILPTSDDQFANAEILTRARLQGLRVVEVGVAENEGRMQAGSATGCRSARGAYCLLDACRMLAAFLPFWWSQYVFPTDGEASGPACSSTRLRGPASLSLRLTGRFWACLLFLAVLAGALLFPHLAYPLVEPDEGRYAEIGREMAASGDWVVPTLNHEPYFDKPPLFYWLVAGSLAAFGNHAWAARLVPTTAAFLTVLATFLFGSRLWGTRAGFLSGLALTLMAGFVHCGRFLILDSTLTLFVALALFSAFLALRGDRLGRRWWAASALFCGLGVLTKGPVAFVLLAPPVAAYAWLNRRPDRPRLVHWTAYAGLVACLAAPWYAAVAAREPGFAYHFFIEHHLQRFFGTEFHDNPTWFYLPVLFLGCLPWSLLLVPFVRFLATPSAAVRDVRCRALGFCMLWAGWCILFFSLSHGKLPPYILPAAPAVALALGCYLEAVFFRNALASFFHEVRTITPRSAALVLSATWLGANVLGWALGWIGRASCPSLGAELVLAVFCLVAAVLWGRKLPFPVAWVVCCTLAVAVAWAAGHRLVPAWAAQRAPLAVSPGIRELLSDGRTGVACRGEDWGSIAFEVNADGLFLNTSKRSVEDLQAFLGRHPRNLLILNDMNLGAARDLVPSGLGLSPLPGSSKAHVLLVQPVEGRREGEKERKREREKERTTDKKE